MTYEEAIVIIRHLWCSEHIDYPDKEVRKALDIAKKALEKQIPMEHHHTRIVKLKIDVRESVCPCCLGVIVTSEKEYPKHCTWCGQRIDWSEGAETYDPV